MRSSTVLIFTLVLIKGRENDAEIWLEVITGTYAPFSQNKPDSVTWLTSTDILPFY